MNIFEKLITSSKRGDILEYECGWSDDYLYDAFVLYYKTDCNIFYKNVYTWSYFNSEIHKTLKTFSTREKAIEFAYSHPTYGDICDYEYVRRQKAKVDELEDYVKYSRQKI